MRIWGAVVHGCAMASVLGASCAGARSATVQDDVTAAPDLHLQAGAKLRAGPWSTDRRSQSFIGGGSFGDDTLAERDSDSGFLAGPEVTCSYKRLWTRAFLVAGTHDAPTDEESRFDAGFDVGVRARYGEVFAGYRRLSTDFDTEDALIEDFDVSDAVLGGRLHTANPRLNVEWEVLFGLESFVNSTGSDQDFAEGPFIFEIEFAATLALTSLYLYAGGGVWSYGDKVLEVPTGPIADTRIETLEALGYGVILGVGYRF